MGRIDNFFMHRLINKRDDAFDKLLINEKFPDVYASLLDKKNNRILEKSSIEAKKRLLPLEISSKPQAEVNKWLYENALKKFMVKHNLNRRAIEQVYLRAVKKQGEEQAGEARAKSIQELDKALADYKAQLLIKHPQASQEPASMDAVAKYERAAKEEESKLKSEESRLFENRKVKLNRETARLEKKNVKLQAVLDKCNKKLLVYNKIGEKEFGDKNILKIQNVKMYFSGVKAVDDISFDIRKGEIFGLIGPNGAGKTTLFNCITQFYKANEGHIFYRERFGHIIDLNEYKTHDVIKTGIVRTFQNLEMVFTLTVLENLLVGAHTFYRANLFDQFLHTNKLKREEEVNKALAMDILQRLGLEQYSHSYPKGLPYGVLKKIELARTLMIKPSLIILDEPAAGLNDAETEELSEIITKIRDDYDCTIFLVEHDMNLVMSVCDTVCAMSFGKMLAYGTPKEIQENRVVQEAYLGVAEDV